MSCQHLSCYRLAGNNWAVAHCAAKETPYVPSLCDLEAFCRSGRHALCPFYLLAGCGAPGRVEDRPQMAAAIIGRPQHGVSKGEKVCVPA